MSRRLTVFACGVALAALAVARPGAQQTTQFPSEPPKAGPVKDFQVPVPTRFTLDNGLEVALVQWGTIPKTYVSLTVRSGNVFESADHVWLADLTGRLMREGTSTRSATDISDQAARMGGSLNVSVGEDETTIGGEVLSESSEAMVELVADVADHPRFPGTELPRLKADLTRELSVALSQPQPLAEQKFQAALYGDHPYGRIFPTAPMIQGYTLDQIRTFYDDTYGAGRSRLYVVGRFDPAAVEARVRKAFGAWAKGPAANPPKPSPRTERVVYLIDRPGAVQSTVMVGVPVIDPTSPDYIPLTVMDALLGGSFGSRITRNIREDKGYTYSPSSEVNTRFHDAYWAETADVTTNVTGPSLKEIFAEIDRLRASPPSPEELEGTENYIAGTYILENSSRRGIAAQLRFIDLQGLPASYANEYVKRVHAVTPEQVTEMARKYLRDEQATIVVVGDRKVIEEQLKPFGRIVTP
ncbi:MAG TPA: pitrilysin family protein [Vicinamibacterales bacterium]|jgi:zinc protease|nr:pitrilysin family protein [Vicinamibacterales bacterium]